MGVLCDASTASMSPQPPSDAPVGALETRRSIRNALRGTQIPSDVLCEVQKTPHSTPCTAALATCADWGLRNLIPSNIISRLSEVGESKVQKIHHMPRNPPYAYHVQGNLPYVEFPVFLRAVNAPEPGPPRTGPVVQVSPAI